jgi:hypothetical protein
MAEKDKNEEIMHVEEDTDGTATVELPDSVEFSQGGEAGEPRQADDGDVDHPDDSEAVRAARRARRRSKKDLIRKTNEEKDVRLGMLQRQNEELMNRLSNVERKTQQHDLGRHHQQVLAGLAQAARHRGGEPLAANDGREHLGGVGLVLDDQHVGHGAIRMMGSA